MNNARLPRVLGAMFYDISVVFAIIFVAAQWFPLVPEQYMQSAVMTLFKQVYILGIAFLYFAYSWHRGGQTIGMKAWRLRVESTAEGSLGERPDWKQCAIRYLVAIISWLAVFMGFIWILFDDSHRSWHDIASSTRLIVIPKIEEK